MADVIALPTAAAAQVVQQPRRGRLPRNIVSFHRGTYLRHVREQALKDQAFQLGLEEGRRRATEERERDRQQREELTEDIEWLKAVAESGHLRSLVYAADVRGRDALRLSAVGKVQGDLNHALAMAARLQHRIADVVEGQESPDQD
jgi:hypothetical protein